MPTWGGCFGRQACHFRAEERWEPGGCAELEEGASGGAQELERYRGVQCSRANRAVGTLRCRGEMGKVSRPDCTPGGPATGRRCQRPACQAWREPGPGLAERFSTDLVSAASTMPHLVEDERMGCGYAARCRHADTQLASLRIWTPRMWTRSSKQASTCLRRCRLAGDKGEHELRGSLLFLFPHPQRAIYLLHDTPFSAFHVHLDIWYF